MNQQKLKQIVVAAVVGAQFTLPVLAADEVASGTNGAASVAASSASSDSSTQAEEIKLLKQQVELLTRKVNDLEHRGPSDQTATIQDLDQKVRILERQREIDQDAATAKAATAPKVTLGANGFSFSSADTNFVTQIHGLVQLDSRSFFDNGGQKGTDGFLLRRARPILTGTVFHDFDYNLTPDFGGNTVQIVDAFLNYRYAPEFQVQVGKFKSPVGLEHLQSDPVTSFNERSLATDLVPNRDLGIALKGDLNGGIASYALGVFNGASDYNGTTTNVYSQNNKAFVSRVFFQPWKNSDVNALRGLGFGVGGSYEIDNPNTNAATGLTPGYTTDGQQKFFTYNKTAYADGKHWRISPQSYYYYGPFSLLGEYVISDQEVSSSAVGGVKKVDVHNDAWEISGGWVLTGEDASFTGITPRHPFDPRNGDWGAFQVVARYAELNVDDSAFKAATPAAALADPTKSADGAQSWAVGLNWFLNKNIRANLSYSHTTFSKYGNGNYAAGSVPLHDESVLFSRIQLSF
jgi:phosphate-selective porin OprO/OprP